MNDGLYEAFRDWIGVYEGLLQDFFFGGREKSSGKRSYLLWFTCGECTVRRRFFHAIIDAALNPLSNH